MVEAPHADDDDDDDDDECDDDLLDEDSQAPGLVPETRALNLLAGRIEILEPIGEGAMGRVFRGYHLALALPVAVKVLDDLLQLRDDSRERFRREAKALGRLQHPGIVRIYDCAELADKRLFLCMELLKGQTLQALRKSGERFRPAQVIDIGIQLCEALQSAHDEGILHRDLSASNIMLLSDPPGRIKVFDWGLCKYLDRFWTRGEHRYDAPPGSRLATPMGARFGTPEYMAPELLAKQGPGTPTPSTDVYAAGVVLFGVLTAGLPFRPGDRKRPRAVAELVPEFACPALEAAICQAIEHNPVTRTQTMTALREGLERARAALDDSASSTAGASMRPFRVALEQAREAAAATSASHAMPSVFVPAVASSPRVDPADGTELARARRRPASSAGGSRALDVAAGAVLGVIGTLAALRVIAPDAAQTLAASPLEVAQNEVIARAGPPERAGEKREEDLWEGASPAAAFSATPPVEPSSISEQPLPTMRDALDAVADRLRGCSELAGGLLFVEFKTAAGRDEFAAVSAPGTADVVVQQCVADATQAIRFQPTTPLFFTEEYMP